MKSNVAVNHVKLLQIARRLLSIIGAVLGITGVIMLVRYYQQELAAVLEVLNQYLRNFKAIMRVASDQGIDSSGPQDREGGRLSPLVGDSSNFRGHRASQGTEDSDLSGLSPDSQHDLSGNRTEGEIGNRVSDLTLRALTPIGNIPAEKVVPRVGAPSQFVNRGSNNNVIRVAPIAEHLRHLGPLTPTTDTPNIFVISKKEIGQNYQRFALFSTDPNASYPLPANQKSSTSTTTTSSVEIEQIFSPPQSRAGSSELPSEQLKIKASPFDLDEQNYAIGTEQEETKTTDSSPGNQPKTPSNFASSSDTIHSASNVPSTFFAALPPKSPDDYKTGETKHSLHFSTKKLPDRYISENLPKISDDESLTYTHRRSQSASRAQDSSTSASSSSNKRRHRRDLSLDICKINFSDLEDEPLDQSKDESGSGSKSKKDKHSPKHS